MKKLVFAVMIMLLSKAAYCQEKISAQKSEEFVFEIPQLDLVKQLADFKQNLKQIKGLEFHGFCESKHLLMVSMPTASKDEFYDLMDKMQYSALEKKQATFRLAEQVCNAKEEINYSKSINQ
ncbi:MAG: hypothetical protein K1X73_00755 [Bacteroidia bacterium]|nr:hypothetical protein [Bacteroidia bacterium]HCI57889.1 hypothetical protein [Bacteroidota bacterium]HMU76777.1 hypothetical protein [Bacteroidia bacterium]HMW09073.1 hypothetical protein [Bacteroidia bacterium]HMX96210.1 hypothetical protein [Bacteroidia bacterium]